VTGDIPVPAGPNGFLGTMVVAFCQRARAGKTTNATGRATAQKRTASITRIVSIKIAFIILSLLNVY
jgi:hypothetical protein